MPGEMQLVEGEVFVYLGIYTVEGLQAALEKWVGRKVSITIEDVTE